ncbi:glycosyltransferase family 1 protein [Chroococcidiopsis sp.]|uniref:glycosyltransferase family 1 protein n=1 Tax=Chroococcidiopsis sp. TaxID=3088168 RepID=UPI003F3D71C1
MDIIQIVPRLPPAIDGLGDYALNLARQLYNDFNLKTHFAIGDAAWTGNTQIEDFLINSVDERSATALLSLLASKPTTVLLHYVGYGYAKRGCPVWLVEGLERWKRNTPNSNLVTMFHEVYASGKLPWTSSFWLSDWQKKLAGRLSQISDRCLTSNQNYAEVLYQLSQGKQSQIPTLPVFSNVGEPKQIPRLTERSRRLVVFGSPSIRKRAYRQSLKELSQVCQLFDIQEILDIGAPTGLVLSSIQGIPIVETGKLSAPEISEILLNSFAGFFNYHLEYLAKSGVFAAYCAHGILTVSPRVYTSTQDGIEPGKHYWVFSDRITEITDCVEVQAIASHAYTWYQTHNLSVQTQNFVTHGLGNICTNIG